MLNCSFKTSTALKSKPGGRRCIFFGNMIKETVLTSAEFSQVGPDPTWLESSHRINLETHGSTEGHMIWKLGLKRCFYKTKKGKNYQHAVEAREEWGSTLSPMIFIEACWHLRHLTSSQSISLCCFGHPADSQSHRRRMKNFPSS